MSDLQFPVDPYRSELQLKFSGRGRIPPREQAKLENIFHRVTAIASWPLKHACSYVMTFEALVDTGVWCPVKKLRGDGLLDKAIAEARAKRLPVGNPAEPEDRWWVYPNPFIKWAVSSPVLIGYHRADILKQFLQPDAIASPEAIARKRVFESKGYRCREFDLACQAIAQFWLEDSDPEGGDRSSDAIKRWINKNFEVDVSAYERIDALIRPDWAKKGGRKPSTPKKQ